MNNFQEERKQKKNKMKTLFSYFLIFVLILLLSFVLESDNILAVKLSNRKVTISDSRTSISNVRYAFQWTGSINVLRCFQILFCDSSTGGCTTPPGINTIVSSKGTWTGLTAANWNLNNGTNGTLKLTNAGGEAPLANVTLEFLGITNPSSQGTYYSRINTYSDLACTTQVDFGTVPFNIIGPGIGITITVPGAAPPPPPPGGGGPLPIAFSEVEFEGKAYPGALVTILRNGATFGNIMAKDSGDFYLGPRPAPVGISNFSIFAEDKDDRKSVTLSFSISIIEGTTTSVKGIFISPTIDLSKEIVRKGEDLDILGYAYPKSKIQIYVESPYPMIKTTESQSSGKWKHTLDTAPFSLGDHLTKAKTVTEIGEQSPFSQEMLFKIMEICKGADLNFDGSVDIVDFSILLYFWKQTNPSNICADINSDGIVNIFDFSIMMYWWTG